MLVSEYAAERGLSHQDIAALLNESGVTSVRGNTIRSSTVKAMIDRERKIPARWETALGLRTADLPGSAGHDPNTPGGRSDERGATAASSPTGRRETPPNRPDEAPIAIVEPGAAKRIAGAYKFVGAALAAGAQPSIGALPAQGIAQVFGDQSDRIAELWLEAARENPWAARFVNVMQAGGPMGDLAAAHLYLAGACAYVVGAGIPGGDAIFPKYSRYRPVVTVPREPSRNGSAGEPEPQPAAADDAAAGAVGNAQV